MAITNEIQAGGDPVEEGKSNYKKKEKLAREKSRLLANIANANLNTLQTRVAWLLNHLPGTRESDVTLQLEYWKHFERDYYSGGVITPDDLYRLTRLTSIARARAVIQNTHGLFQASEEVRQRRGTLEEQERADVQATNKGVNRAFTVYTDESGKTSSHLIIGSVWLLNGIESRAIVQDISNWRENVDFKDELHFAKIGRGSLDFYLEALSILHRHSAALSFKAIVLPRKGISNIEGALGDMLYHLIVRGVAHEHDSGRAELPRMLQIWKDAENESSDKLLLANLRERLGQAAASRFGGELTAGDMVAFDSKDNVFLQFADLFVSSVNRVLNATDNDSNHPKDAFAKELLHTFHVKRANETFESVGDVALFEDI